MMTLRLPALHTLPPANPPQLGVVQDVAAVKDEGRLDHAVVDGLVVVALELVPLGQHADGVRIAGRLHGVLRSGQARQAAWVAPTVLLPPWGRQAMHSLQQPHHPHSHG